VKVVPIEVTAADIEAKRSQVSSAPSKEEVQVPPLKLDAIRSEEAHQKTSEEMHQLLEPITAQTFERQNQQVRQVCQRLERQLRKRSILIGDDNANADIQVKVRVTELGFDSLNGFDYRADATTPQWTVSAEGKSLDKIADALAKQVSERLQKAQ